MSAYLATTIFLFLNKIILAQSNKPVWKSNLNSWKQLYFIMILSEVKSILYYFFKLFQHDNHCSCIIKGTQFLLYGKFPWKRKQLCIAVVTMNFSFYNGHWCVYQFSLMKYKSLVLLATGRHSIIYMNILAHTHIYICNAQRRWINSKDAKVQKTWELYLINTSALLKPIFK